MAAFLAAAARAIAPWIGAALIVLAACSALHLVLVAFRDEVAAFRAEHDATCAFCSSQRRGR